MTDSLMMALAVKMVDVLIERQSQAAFADEPESIEAFVLERFDEALAMGVGIGRRHRAEHGVDSSNEQDALEGGRILSIVVADQMGDAVRGQKAGVGHGEIASDLGHDDVIGRGMNAGDMHLPGR